MASKIVKSGGARPDRFEEEVAKVSYLQLEYGLYINLIVIEYGIPPRVQFWFISVTFRCTLD